jgi:hypothetical protein
MEMESNYGDWNAREWFLIRKAEVSMSASSVLIPHIKMGVEAREQRLNGNSLEDAPISRPDHPLVKYADEFTKNFDLIAERKSAIYHLRELAKAVVLARFIDEANIQLSDAWFRLGGNANSFQVKNLYVPQLWNERFYSKIEIKDGAIVYDRDKGKTVRSSGRGVYGGVSLGLPALSASAVVPGKRDFLKIPKVKPVLSKGNLKLDIKSTEAAPRSSLMGKILKGEKLKVPGLVTVAEEAPEIPEPDKTKGVDLRLDAFDLTAALYKHAEDQPPLAQHSPLEKCVALGGEFWKSLDSAANNERSAFSGEDKAFLSELFNPSLSDRRIEGHGFVPPQSSKKYLAKLRNLLQDEEAVRKQRLDLFFSQQFAMGNPGSLFPSSWTPKSGIACGAAPTVRMQEGRAQRVLTRVAAHDAAAHIMRHSTPLFDMATEDGLRFRVYQAGCLEVRTTQARSGKEQIGAVFSFRAPLQTDPWDPWDECVKEQERPVKATEYVEWAWECRDSVSGDYVKNCHFYVVLEDEHGNRVLTEQSGSGKTLWVENPEDLEDRTALAKVIASTSCVEGASFRQLREYQSKCGCPSRRAQASSQRYARRVYNRSCGRELEK